MILLKKRRNSDTLASFIYQVIDIYDKLDISTHIYNREVDFIEDLYFDQKDINKESIYKILNVLDNFFDKNEEYINL